MPSTKKLLQAAAGNAGDTLGYVEDVFSTYLYEGTGTAQTITNGIDLDGEGGMVWIKTRNVSSSNVLFDTERGVLKAIYSNLNVVEDNDVNSITSFNSNGFTDNGSNSLSGRDYASWTFRKAEKFFDVVTWTGDGTSNRQIPHNLGITPGCIFVKSTNAVRNWSVFHTSLGSTKDIALNSTNVAFTNSTSWNDTSPTDTEFTVGSYGNVNTSGNTYVAYLFASDAGGFGDDGSESIIKCGSFTAPSQTTFDIDLGFEPQFFLVKKTSESGDWYLIDVMRGFNSNAEAGPQNKVLRANTSGPEGAEEYYRPTATGIQGWHLASADYIYIAIRRPMKTPTAGTEVFNSELVTATQATKIVTGIGFSPDLLINGVRSNANYGQQVTDRLRGVNKQLFTEYTSAESTTNGTALVSLDMDGFTLGADTGGTGWNAYSGYTSVKWAFKRATGFFDVVAYSGTGSATTQAHNLGVVPELIILKGRSGPIAFNWPVYSKSILNTESLFLNYPDGKANVNNTYWNSTTPTNTNFSLGSGSQVNASGGAFIAYLFATLAGVSKVGSYTGTGADLNVDCGFSAGARFILIKRTDSTGDWYVWDSARGIVAGNDPYLLLNSAAAEVTGTDYIDPLASGFTVTSSAPAGLNASGGTYIFLAIA
jgi:hypothetical protein